MRSPAFRTATSGIGFVPDANCALWLPGQDDAYSATIRDRSGNGNNGTITGVTWDILGSSLRVNKFDGNDDLIDCGNSQTLKPTTITMLGWAMFTDITQFGGLVDRSAWNDTAFGVYTFNKSDVAFILRLNNAAATATWTHAGNLVNDKWYLLAAKYDPTLGSANLDVLVDGVSKATANYTTALAADTNKTRIGTYYGSGLAHNGSLALWRIFSRNVPTAEILRIRQSEGHLFGV